MKRSILVIATIVWCSAGILSGCKELPREAPPEKLAGTYSEKGSVREMTITPESVEFPEHEGKKEFISYCGICHSLRYVTTQPDFPRKTWDAEVTKMIVKYGAPIDSLNAKKIVDYLVAIKGVKE
jgi:hypothetical protein